MMSDRSSQVRTVVFAQVAHLMASADADKDGVLSMDEILSDTGRDAFRSSLATDFGEAAQYHDEL